MIKIAMTGTVLNMRSAALFWLRLDSGRLAFHRLAHALHTGTQFLEVSSTARYCSSRVSARQS